MTFAEETPVHLKHGRILLFRSKIVRGFRLPVHLKFATDDCLKPFDASFSQFDSCHIYYAIGKPEDLLMSRINSLHLK